MNKLVTVSRRSPDFKKYILGTFSKELRAIPVEALGPVHDRDQVTFELVPQSQIQIPSTMTVFFKTIRLKQFIFVLFPLFYLFLQSGFMESVQDPFLVVFSIAGILSLFASLQLRNDFHDHLNGLDRIRHQGVSTPLLKGWVTARKVSSWAWAFAGISFLLAIPLVFVFPILLVVLFLSTALLGWSLYRPLSSFKNIFAGEVVFGFLVGPLLCLGFQISVTGTFSPQGLLFGFLWGMVVLFKMYLQSFENMAALSQAKVKNILNTLGFDQSKKFLLVWWTAFLFLFTAFQAHYFHFLVWSGTVIILSVFSFRFYKKLQMVNSPLGSSMSDLHKEGQQLFDLLVSLWILQSLFSFLAPSFFGVLTRGI